MSEFIISCGTKIDISKVGEYFDRMNENLEIEKNERNLRKIFKRFY